MRERKADNMSRLVDIARSFVTAEHSAESHRGRETETEGEKMREKNKQICTEKERKIVI